MKVYVDLKIQVGIEMLLFCTVGIPESRHNICNNVFIHYILKDVLFNDHGTFYEAR